MKRILTIALALLLLVAVCLPAAADGEVNLQTSRLCPAAPYRDYVDCFTEAERLGMSSTLNRAALCTVLAHYFGVTDSTVPEYCTDVEENAWYAAGVNWAIKNGFFSITEFGIFSPDTELTREELSFILRRSAELNGMTISQFNPWFNFNDGAFFSSPYYQESASWLQMAGVLIEDKDGCIHPQDKLTVGEFETLLLRFAYACGDAEEKYRSYPCSTVEESAPVDDSWFDDACFIGHSQVVGMQKYFDLPNIDYYAVVGYSARGIITHETIELPQGGLGTLEDGLANNSYGKVYIMLGINDCSDRETRKQEFVEPMTAILDLVKKTQPNAVIYLLSLAPVGHITPNNYLYNPDNTLIYSQYVKSLARQYEAEYLDVFRLMSDRNGYFLPEFDAGDGIHIPADQYGIIKDYLKTHT